MRARRLCDGYSSMVARTGGTTAARRKAAAKKHAHNARKSLVVERQQSTLTEVDLWWARHDADGGGTLDEAEFKALLIDLFPERPPDDEVVGQLITACGGEITRQNVSPMLAKP